MFDIRIYNSVCPDIYVFAPEHLAHIGTPDFVLREQKIIEFLEGLSQIHSYARITAGKIDLSFIDFYEVNPTDIFQHIPKTYGYVNIYVRFKSQDDELYYLLKYN